LKGHVKREPTKNGETPELVALSKWLREIGRSDTTGWRWRQAGWLHPVNIAGRPYLTGDDIRQFQARAAAGEFSKAPSGAALKSAEKRAAEEAQQRTAR
jgi:hypothetical protein